MSIYVGAIEKLNNIYYNKMIFKPLDKRRIFLSTLTFYALSTLQLLFLSETVRTLKKSDKIVPTAILILPPLHVVCNWKFCEIGDTTDFSQHNLDIFYARVYRVLNAS